MHFTLNYIKFGHYFPYYYDRLALTNNGCCTKEDETEYLIMNKFLNIKKQFGLHNMQGFDTLKI